jgi:signal peptidase II
VSARHTSRPARVTVVLALIAAAFTIDQLTKTWALTGLSDGRTIELALGARFVLVFNPGMAFGLGASFGPPLVIVLLVVAAALTAWVLLRAIQRKKMLGTAFLALAAGGALGNIWDRLTRATNGPLTGEVVDFIAVDWFAIFNVADIFTTCGIAGWALLQALSPDTTTPDPGLEHTPQPTAGPTNTS